MSKRIDNHSIQVLTVDRLSKSFDRKLILSDISFRIYKREIVGLMGPNGAGKTTLLLILLGLITPDKGTVSIFSNTIQKALPRINFASSSHRLNGYASVWENLLTFARLYNVQNPKGKIYGLAHIFGIVHLLKSGIKVYSLSAGENTKVNVCKAFLNDPQILFLDEITAHLDQGSTTKTLAYIKYYTRQASASVIYVTHKANEAKGICDRFVLLDRGKIRYYGNRLPMLSPK